MWSTKLFYSLLTSARVNVKLQFCSTDFIRMTYTYCIYLQNGVIFVQSTVHIKFNASVPFNICFRILQTALKQQIKRLFKPSEQSACIKNDRLPNNDITHVLRLCNFLVHCKWHGISQNLTEHRDTQMEMTYSNQIVFYKRHQRYGIKY